MSISIDSECLQCHLNRSLETARSLGDDEKAVAFAKELMKMYISAAEGISSPYFGPATTELFQKFYGLDPDRYVEEKRQSNAFILERYDDIARRVRNAPDPLRAGVQFAILGNYLDFAALRNQVSFETLDEMLEKALEMELDETVFASLKADLAKGRRLLYLTDNCGEIGIDRILAEEIHKEFPDLQITFCVRGGPTHNDATREDAAAVGIPFPVIDNGNTVGGTAIPLLSPAAKEALETADVVIAKGMGNTETLYGCGYNVYYAFLVKCGRFQRKFQKPLMTPMLVRERA